MVADVRGSGFRSMPCFIHTIQLCIHDSILSQKFVKDILACCRCLATHFHHSPIAAAKLESIQEQLGTNKHRLIQDITKRLNSSYDIIERMLDQKIPVAIYTADHSTQSTLNSFQWGLLDKVLYILEPFKTLTINFSKHESYLSDVIPSIMALEEFFNQALVCEAFLTINTLVEHLSGSVDKRLVSYLHDKYSCLSTFCDPRYNLTYKKEDKDIIKNWINEQMQEMRQSNLELESSDSDFDEFFSTGHIIYEPNRNRLSPESGKKLMFIHYNNK
ncbi:zinc finger BED domain-containing protein 4-like [Hydra vulgaris]|uniref:zinc finger BED domain-containing protein 4-like n=1 Tax=Hydra vulgaris TaxID=6087 RepID=UPI001F5EE9FA|nr:zinc finger BED domain-containing protein 4-like [Hydra vulgaris]